MHSRLESRLEATNQLLADAALGRSRGDSVRGMTWRAICVRPCWWDFPGSVEQYMHRVGKGLHSSTSQLNLRAFHGIGGARRGCVAHVEGVFGGV